MSVSWTERQRRVAARAGQRCEYCRMHQDLQGAVFHVEHIVPTSLGGGDKLDNLAWACPGCNLSKAARVTALDPVSGQEVRLFHPRQDRWAEHFTWHGSQLVGLTATGRAFIATLNLNSERRMRIRRVEARFGLFPPE